MAHYSKHEPYTANKEHINRFKMAHCIGVAEYMRENAYKYNLNANQMYVIGLLHDIGYLEGRNNHEQTGFEILLGVGVQEPKTLFAVSMHGGNLYDIQKNNPDYSNLLTDCPELILLCEADMSIDARGYNVGFEGRLKDLGDRYGYEHIAYQTACDNIQFITNALEKLKKEDVIHKKKPYHNLSTIEYND